MTMTTPTPREAERQAFEEFAVRKFGRGMLSRAANGPYVWDDVSDAWRIWQAARAALAAVQPIPEQPQTEQPQGNLAPPQTNAVRGDTGRTA